MYVPNEATTMKPHWHEEQQREPGTVAGLCVGGHLASPESFRSWLGAAPAGSVVGYRGPEAGPLDYYLLSEGDLEASPGEVDLPEWARLFQGRLRFAEDGRPRYGHVSKEEALAELEYAVRPFVVRDSQGGGGAARVEIMRRAGLLRTYPHLAPMLVNAAFAYLKVRVDRRVIEIEPQDCAERQDCTTS